MFGNSCKTIFVFYIHSVQNQKLNVKLSTHYKTRYTTSKLQSLKNDSFFYESGKVQKKNFSHCSWRSYSLQVCNRVNTVSPWFLLILWKWKKKFPQILRESNLGHWGFSFYFFFVTQNSGLYNTVHMVILDYFLRMRRKKSNLITWCYIEIYYISTGRKTYKVTVIQI